MKAIFARENIAGILALVAIGVLGYLAVRGSEQALGAIVYASGSATAWYLRGRTQEPKS